MTNTERLISDLAFAKSIGSTKIEFRVGRCTGNSPSVITSLRRRGYIVERVKGTTYSMRGE